MPRATLLGGSFFTTRFSADRAAAFFDAVFEVAFPVAAPGSFWRGLQPVFDLRLHRINAGGLTQIIEVGGTITLLCGAQLHDDHLAAGPGRRNTRRSP